MMHRFRQWLAALIAGSEPTHQGYTLHEVMERAMEDGTLEAWEWLQTWWSSIEDNSEEAHYFTLWMAGSRNDDIQLDR